MSNPNGQYPYYEYGPNQHQGPPNQQQYQNHQQHYQHHQPPPHQQQPQYHPPPPQNFQRGPTQAQLQLDDLCAEVREAFLRAINVEQQLQDFQQKKQEIANRVDASRDLNGALKELHRLQSAVLGAYFEYQRANEDYGRGMDKIDLLLKFNIVQKHMITQNFRAHPTLPTQTAEVRKSEFDHYKAAYQTLLNEIMASGANFWSDYSEEEDLKKSEMHELFEESRRKIDGIAEDVRQNRKSQREEMEEMRKLMQEVKALTLQNQRALHHSESLDSQIPRSLQTSPTPSLTWDSGFSRLQNAESEAHQNTETLPMTSTEYPIFTNSPIPNSTSSQPPGLQMPSEIRRVEIPEPLPMTSTSSESLNSNSPRLQESGIHNQDSKTSHPQMPLESDSRVILDTEIPRPVSRMETTDEEPDSDDSDFEMPYSQRVTSSGNQNPSRIPTSSDSPNPKKVSSEYPRYHSSNEYVSPPPPGIPIPSGPTPEFKFQEYQSQNQPGPSRRDSQGGFDSGSSHSTPSGIWNSRDSSTSGHQKSANQPEFTHPRNLQNQNMTSSDNPRTQNTPIRENQNQDRQNLQNRNPTSSENWTPECPRLQNPRDHTFGIQNLAQVRGTRGFGQGDDQDRGTSPGSSSSSEFQHFGIRQGTQGSYEYYDGPTARIPDDIGSSSRFDERTAMQFVHPGSNRNRNRNRRTGGGQNHQNWYKK